MLQANNIKIMLFTILCVCFIFYLFMGIYNYKRNKKSKVNATFLISCICTSLWAIGYAFMLISPNIGIANIWRIISVVGSCFFNAIWTSFILSLIEIEQKKTSSRIQLLVYMASIIFFISDLTYEPSKVISSNVYGFVYNLYFTTTIGIVFSIYMAVIFITSMIMICFQMRTTKKNRVRKQMKVILITCSITFCLAVTTDLISPVLGIMIFPTGIIAFSIGMGGIWYAINKHKMMSISYELVSEYLFEAVNEPIFILGEDFLIKSCNEASVNITGYNRNDLEQISLDAIIDFRSFNFNTIIEEKNAINIEVNLLSEFKGTLVCELSSTVIYDEYKDILGILILLHDVSERKSIADVQNKYTLKLEESNFKLKNEITERLIVEEQIHHFIYYDALTEVLNRKKMLEDINRLLDNKNEKFAILFIDLDKFKSANDNYGHQAGDYILKIVAVRLKSIINPIDTVYRIGGDEFIIILRNLRAITNAEKIATTALKTLGSSFTYQKNQLLIGLSIGISIFPEHGIDEDTLIKKADLAMYEAKRNGGNGYKMYSSEMEVINREPLK